MQQKLGREEEISQVKVKESHQNLPHPKRAIEFYLDNKNDCVKELIELGQIIDIAPEVDRPLRPK